jgi:hypothetical protein
MNGLFGPQEKKTRAGAHNEIITDLEKGAIKCHSKSTAANG